MAEIDSSGWSSYNQIADKDLQYLRFQASPASKQPL